MGGRKVVKGKNKVQGLRVKREVEKEGVHCPPKIGNEAGYTLERARERRKECKWIAGSLC